MWAGGYSNRRWPENKMKTFFSKPVQGAEEKNGLF